MQSNLLSLIKTVKDQIGAAPGSHLLRLSWSQIFYGHKIFFILIGWRSGNKILSLRKLFLVHFEIYANPICGFIETIPPWSLGTLAQMIFLKKSFPIAWVIKVQSQLRWCHTVDSLSSYVNRAKKEQGKTLVILVSQEQS